MDKEKYFNYFTKKAKEAFRDVKEISETKIEFSGGLTLYYDFKDLSNNVTNANYKQEVYEAIKDIRASRNEEISIGVLKIINTLKDKLQGHYKTIEFIDLEEEDGLKFVNMKNVEILRKFPKNVIPTTSFHDHVLPLVIDEMATLTPEELVESYRRLDNDQNG